MRLIPFTYSQLGASPIFTSTLLSTSLLSPCSTFSSIGLKRAELILKTMRGLPKRLRQSKATSCSSPKRSW